MSITVADLKSILDVGVTTYDDLLFYYENEINEEIAIDDVGTLTEISKDCHGVEITSSYFAFVANASGETSIDYNRFTAVLKDANDTDIVYFVDQTPSLPQTEEIPITIGCAKLDVDRISASVSRKTSGVLVLTKEIISSSSSSSSSSSEPHFINEIKTLLSSDGDVGDDFGKIVSISGDYAIVGASGRDGNGVDFGSAYVFYKDQGGVNNWGEVKKLLASDGVAGDNFGQSVSISGDYAIVGANGRDDGGLDLGAIYVFYRNQGGANNWGEVKKLLPSDGVAGDSFGQSISISDGYIIVGSHYKDDNGSNSGSAYVFYRNQGGIDNWGEMKKLLPSDGDAGDYFGKTVFVSGDYAIVGAYFNDDNGSDSGSAYIFYKDQGGVNNWGEIKKLLASDRESNDYFGQSVSISGDYAVVGSIANDDNGYSSGSAYIFYKDQGGVNNWGEIKILNSSDGATFDYLGYSVSILGNYIIVGSPYDDDNGSNSGSAYVFYKDQGGIDNWGEVKKLLPSDGEDNDNFGYSASISGNYVVVGAYNHNGIGSTYMFDVSNL